MGSQPPSPNNAAYQGAAGLSSGTSDLNVYDYLIRIITAGQAHVTIGLVKACTNSGGVALAGTVDIQPMIAQIDGDGNATVHGVVHGLPYIRAQGGVNAIIMDPAVGDIGVVVFADRDISSVKANKAPANPGSRRQFDWADGVYIGGLLNGVPTQYIQFSSSGITMLSPTQIKLQAPDIQFVGPTHTTGAVTGDSTAIYQGDVTGDGTHLHTHEHSGVATGSSNTGPPV